MWKPSGRSGRGEDMGLQGAGSGLSKGKLQLATAVPGDVVAGKTFYAGDKDLKTGILQEMPGITDANSIQLYDYGMYFRINKGAYRTQGGAPDQPEIRANLDNVLNTLIRPAVAWNSVKPGDNQNETWTYGIQRGTVWVMVVQGTGQDANTVAGCSISTPNCTTLFDVDVNVTTNPSNATRPLKIRGFRANADTTVSGYTMCGTGHAARYFGLYRIV